MKKVGASESTIIVGPSKSVLVYALHSLEYVPGLARFRVFVPKLSIIMLWDAIFYYGTCELQFFFSLFKMNEITYKRVIEKAFQPFDNIFGPIPWTFQHDNAPIHTATA